MTITTLHGDCRDILLTMPERSVQCVVTSPPYYGLRRYSNDPREIGQEAQPDCLAWARGEMMQLRDDLTDEEVLYVYSELKKAGAL